MMRASMPTVGVLSRKRQPGRGWRAAVVLGMPAMPLAAVGITAVPAAATTTYAVTAIIGVGDSPDLVTVDPPTHTVYVTNGGTGLGAGFTSVINGRPTPRPPPWRARR